MVAFRTARVMIEPFIIYLFTLGIFCQDAKVTGPDTIGDLAEGLKALKTRVMKGATNVGKLGGGQKDVFFSRNFGERGLDSLMAR